MPVSTRRIRCPIEPAHRQYGAELDHDLEHLGLVVGVVEQAARDDQMAGG
jgi:hypothetical protein